MEEKKGNGLSKFFLILICVICIVMIILVAIAFIVFSHRDEKVIEKTKNGGDIVLNYSSNVNGLSIVGATPTTDALGIKDLTDGKYFDFSVDVSVKDANYVEYEISITKNSANSSISDDDIRIYLEKEESGSYSKVFGPSKFKALKEKTKLGSGKGTMVLYSTQKKKSTVDNYRLRMWLSDKSVSQIGNYAVEINLNGKAK